MAIVTLCQVKEHLRVTHDSDDVLLELLMNAAVDEANQYTENASMITAAADAEDAVSSSEPIAVPASYQLGVLLLVQASYAASNTDEQAALRKIAETKLTPFRTSMGI